MTESKDGPSEFARRRVARCFCDERHIVDLHLIDDVAKLLDKYIDALIWCSGSEDFGEGGKAELGWNKMCRPLIN